MSESLVQFVLRGARRTFVLRGAGLGIAFLSHTYFARLLGRDEYGIYVFALAWVSVLVLLSTLGLDTLLTRYLAVYKGVEEWGKMQGLLRWANSTATKAALAVLVLGVLIVTSVRTGMSEEMRATFYFGFPLVFVLTLKNIRQGALRGMRLVVQSETVDNLVRPVLMLGFVFGSAQLLTAIPRAHHLMGANLVAAAAALAFLVVLVARAWPAQARAHAPEYEQREWLGTAMPLLITAGIYLLLSRTDILMLGLLNSTSSAAVYGVITRFSDLMMLGLVSSTAMIGPIAAELHKKGERGSLQAVVTKAVQWSSALTALMGLGLVVFGRPLLSLFGEGFVEGYAPMIVLLAGQGINAFAGPVGYLLSMTGHQGRVVRVLGGSAVLNIGLNALLIPAFGVMGAASATAVTNLVWNVILHVSVMRTLQIDSTALGRR